MRSCIIIGVLILTTSLPAYKTDLPIPRFVSLRSTEVNVRVGPGLHFPLRWQLVRREPVEITAEFTNWRKIRCHDGAEGWVHQSMLSGKRLAKIAKDTVMRRGSFNKARPLAEIKENVVGELEVCKGQWCKIKVNDLKGWVPKDSIWGVYEHEETL